MKRLFTALVFFFGLIGSSQAMKAEDVKLFTLENGMKIIVVEDYTIPNANMYLFWKVGSRNEVPGITGLSHFFEHMMFNGAKKYGPKMFDRVMEAAGGANNAYTTENLTAYTDWFPASSLETMFELEADRIANLDINAEVLESERDVVMSERRTGLENSNWRVLNEEVKAAAFRAHPYSWSVIGHESDIMNWKLDDLIEYHKTYYTPNNAIVVISGAVEFEQVKKLADKYFAPIQAQPKPRDVLTIEPEQKGERRVYVQKSSVSTPNMMVAYHVPHAMHQDFYALSLLETILGWGNSSRLERSLVDKGLVISADTHMSMSIDPNLFYFYLVASEGIGIEEIEQAFVAQINDLIANGVSERELTKAKNMKLMDFYREQETINGKSSNIGTYELFFGNYEALFNVPEALEKITVDDIKRVAHIYFRKSNRTVGVLAAKEDRD
ncbi:insulinase family protein [Photobacterium sagamiensis]|uniref:M16 family metallopeptidase n=1 Tax=Photobacterium sagamiensis TaxID=2910241 RepID=UPI003D0B5F75